MRLRQIVRLLRRWGWVVWLTMLLTSAAALATSRLQTPVYRSTIAVNVWPARLDLGLQQTIQGLMRNYAAAIQSRETAFRVSTDLELDITPEQLLEKLSVESIESDYVIRIEADDYDPLIAQAIAQRTAEVFVQATKVQMVEEEKRDRVEVSILDPAQPGELHKPNWRLNALAGAVAGLALGILLLYVLQRLDAEIIRTSEDIERRMGLTVLAAVPMASSDKARSGGAV